MNELNARTVRALFGKSSNRTNRQPVVAVVVVPVEMARIKTRAPRTHGLERIRRRELVAARGPVAAERAFPLPAALIAAAGSGKEDAL